MKIAWVIRSSLCFNRAYSLHRTRVSCNQSDGGVCAGGRPNHYSVNL